MLELQGATLKRADEVGPLGVISTPKVVPPEAGRP